MFTDPKSTPNQAVRESSCTLAKGIANNSIHELFCEIGKYRPNMTKWILNDTVGGAIVLAGHRLYFFAAFGYRPILHRLRINNE